MIISQKQPSSSISRSRSLIFGSSLEARWAGVVGVGRREEVADDVADSEKQRDELSELAVNELEFELEDEEYDTVVWGAIGLVGPEEEDEEAFSIDVDVANDAEWRGSFALRLLKASWRAQVTEQ